jgi:hypothetical protein
MMALLCPRSIGMDTRTEFINEEGNSITAVLVRDIWE